MPQDETRSDAHNWGSGPDPSALTTAQLLREIASLSERMEIRVDGEIKVLSAQLEALEKSITKAADDYTRVPTDVEKAVGNLQALHEVRFEGVGVKFDAVQTQLAERDQKVSEVALATRTAVDAALAAAEKARTSQAESAGQAAAKAEAATVKQIDQQAALYQTETRALRDICNTLDRRLTAIESMNLGSQTSQRDTHSASTLVIAIIAVLFSALSAAAAWVHTALK